MPLTGQQFGILADISQKQGNPVALGFQAAYDRQQAIQVTVTAAKFPAEEHISHRHSSRVAAR